MRFTLAEVKKKADIKKFIKFPNKLYEDNKQYVPALIADEFSTLVKSPSLEYCLIRMWMAVTPGGEIIGRIAGIINPRSNEYHNERRIRFGWFDFIDDIEVASALLERVASWGRENGLDEIHGPLGYNTLGKQGMLIEGFENTPPINCLYNYPYYSRIMDELDFNTQLDWVQIKIGAGEHRDVPDKVKQFNDNLLKRYNLRVLDMSELKNTSKYIKSFHRSYNEGFKEIDNFVPFTEAEIEKVAREYFPKLKNGLTTIIVDEEDNIAGFAISIPSLSEAFKKAKGRVFPFGFIHILKGFRNYRVIDLLLIGAADKWRNKGISSIFQTDLISHIQKLGIKYAITNPQKEHNPSLIMLEKYDYEPYMRRRCYIKNI